MQGPIRPSPSAPPSGHSSADRRDAAYAGQPQTARRGYRRLCRVDTNSFAEAFERIIAANSRYYLLGYAPPAHPRDGRFHRIEVRVKRPGLTVTARRGYPSPSGKTTQEKNRKRSNDGIATAAQVEQTTPRSSCDRRSTAPCSNRG